MSIINFFSNKNILITGHSGFKGSWLSSVLNHFGANVFGLSDFSVESGYYIEVKNNFSLKELKGDITNQKFVNKIFDNYKFHIVFHFAAQGLVSKAFEYPLETIKTNILGTYNILESCNRNKEINTLIVATTDKVYKNHNENNSENFELGGNEFYSASKASSELLIDAFKNTRKRDNLNIGIIRAGNVLGGGDYGQNRIVTDILSSLKGGHKLLLTNPSSIRPWQYILDCINGYLMIAEYCTNSKEDEIFNLSSNENNQVNVETLANKLVEFWKPSKEIKVLAKENKIFKESDILKIDSSKAYSILNWKPKYNIDNICKSIVDYEKSKDKYKWSINHIDKFFDI